MRALKNEFSKVFWKYQYLWVPGDWTEVNSTPSVRRTRNSARRTLVSTVEVHFGSCWRISVSHDQAGQPRMSSCPTGTHQVHEHAKLVNYAELIGSQCRLWRTGVMWSRIPVPATSLAAAFWTRWSGSIVDCGKPARTEYCYSSQAWLSRTTLQTLPTTNKLQQYVRISQTRPSTLRVYATINSNNPHSVIRDSNFSETVNNIIKLNIHHTTENTFDESIYSDHMQASPPFTKFCSSASSTGIKLLVVSGMHSVGCINFPILNTHVIYYTIFNHDKTGHLCIMSCIRSRA